MKVVEGDGEWTVLIIDDKPANLGVMVDFLEGLGMEVVVAENGESGIARAIYVRPDLILLDLLMPGMDGYETCKRLKADDRTAGIPVIFMTALTGVAEKVRGFEAGGVDYVTKPVQLDEAAARIRTHLTMARLRRELQEKNAALEAALSRVKLLSGLLPICSSCKKIRDDKGYWNQIETYILEHSEAEFSHSICPECFDELYPEYSAKE